MVGICKETGAVLDGLQSSLQGVVDILNTRLRSVLMLREYGAGGPELLGRNLTVSLLAMYRQLVCVSIDLWEPRLKVRTISFSGTAAEFKNGIVGILIEADYRPGALQDPPDYTVDQTVSFSLLNSDGSLVVSS
ncbi:GPW/gp25 family protein [Cohaesibacter marisflavi]|uniref:GPW/gp25 family protein n=1 Tax=Cohaesibacter marisflavi TaxID=655353 RepID=UPI0029C6B226|nr:GPW/gp25 family protein [Cohaesibacter marisflavi]